MRNKICMVTGATSGIGLETARALAHKGYRVIVVARDPAKGKETIARLQKETDNPAVELMLADLSVQAQTRRLAETFKLHHDRLDVLINNAGAFFWKRQLSADGIEMTLAVNHLAPFLLTNRLLDTLRGSTPARIVNVSSDSHRTVQIDWDDLQRQSRYNPMEAYGQSKLAMLLFSYELARRLEGTRVTVNALHPGFVATNIGQNNGWLFKLAKPVIKLLGKSPQKGAETAVYLACSPEVADVTGKYFVNKQAVPSSPASYDEDAGARLWKISADMTRLNQ